MAISSTTACGYTVRRTAKTTEQAKSTIGYLSNSCASCMSQKSRLLMPMWWLICRYLHDVIPLRMTPWYTCNGIRRISRRMGRGCGACWARGRTMCSSPSWLIDACPSFCRHLHRSRRSIRALVGDRKYRARTSSTFGPLLSHKFVGGLNSQYFMPCMRRFVIILANHFSHYFCVS